MAGKKDDEDKAPPTEDVRDTGANAPEPKDNPITPDDLSDH